MSCQDHRPRTMVAFIFKKAVEDCLGSMCIHTTEDIVQKHYATVGIESSSQSLAVTSSVSAVSRHPALST